MNIPEEPFPEDYYPDPFDEVFGGASSVPSRSGV